MVRNSLAGTVSAQPMRGCLGPPRNSVSSPFISWLQFYQLHWSGFFSCQPWLPKSQLQWSFSVFILLHSCLSVLHFHACFPYPLLSAISPLLPNFLFAFSLSLHTFPCLTGMPLSTNTFESSFKFQVNDCPHSERLNFLSPHSVLHSSKVGHLFYLFTYIRSTYAIYMYFMLISNFLTHYWYWTGKCCRGYVI